MNLLLIGFGYWGKKIFHTLNQFKDFNVLIYDKKINKISLDDFLIKNSQFDHVFIATPEETHYQLVKKFLLLKKNIFVEKPLCLKKNQANKLVDLALKNQVILFVDYIFLYDNFLKRIKELLDSKFIGKIQKIESLRHSSSISKPKIIVTDDLMIHDLYLFRYLFNIDNEQLLIKDFINKDFQEVKLAMTYKDYLDIYTSYSWVAEEPFRKLSIFGQKGFIAWEKNMHAETLKLTINNKQTLIKVVNKYSPLYKSIKSFFDRTKKPDQIYNDFIVDVNILSKIRSILYEDN